MAPESLSAIQRTEDGLTVDTHRARDAILAFLRQHPGQYFGVHDFSYGKTPTGDPIPDPPEMEPFWWLSDWGKERGAPEGFEWLSSQDPRLNFPWHVTHVGFVGVPGATRIGPTKDQVLAAQKTRIAKTDAILDEVYDFLAAHRGTAYTEEEIADALAMKKPRHRYWLALRKIPPSTSASGADWLTITSTLSEVASWRSRNGDESIWKGIITTWHNGGRYYGLPGGV